MNNASAEKAVSDRWTSRLGFLYATAAAAIGLGSLWRFPYVAGANGGGAFVIMYIAFVVVLCVPLMIAEMSMGRLGHGSVVGSVTRLVNSQGLSPGWNAIGWLSLAIPFIGFSYYSIVAGWCIDYVREAIFVGFEGVRPSDAHSLFDTLIGSPVRQGAFQFAFIMVVATIVALGVQRGIELISKVKMTALFFILTGLVIYNAITVGLGPSATFLLKPDFSALTGASILTAMGQAFFSTAIGVGVLMTYSAYLPPNVSIPKSAAVVSGSVIFVSLLAGLAIFPIVLANGLTPAEGPGLIFVTLPVAFSSMPGGRVIAIAFFALTTIGATTTAVGMLEPVTAWLREATGLRRPTLAYAAGGAVWLVGLPSLLSFSVLKDVHPLAGLPGFADKTIFNILDFGIAEFLQPINAALIALFAAWSLRKVLNPGEVGLPPRLHLLWRIIAGIVAPVAIIALMSGALI